MDDRPGDRYCEGFAQAERGVGSFAVSRLRLGYPGALGGLTGGENVDESQGAIAVVDAKTGGAFAERAVES